MYSAPAPIASVAMEAALSSLEAALMDLRAMRTDVLSNPERLAVLQRIEIVSRALPAVGLQVVAQLHQQWSNSDFRCGGVVDVLADGLRISPIEARARWRASDDLACHTEVSGEVLEPPMPATAAAQLEGAIGAAHVKVIREVLHRLPGTVDAGTKAQAETELAQHARSLRPDQLRQAANRVEAYLNPDGNFSDLDRARRRSLRIGKQGPDLMSVCPLVADPELRAYLDAILAKGAKPGVGNPEDSTPCFDDDPDADAVQRDRRTPAQRQHDALKAVLRDALASGRLGQHRGLPVTVIVSTTLTELEAAARVAAADLGAASGVGASGVGASGVGASGVGASGGAADIAGRHIDGAGLSGSSSGWTGLSVSDFDGTGRSPGESGLDGTGGRGSGPDETGRSGSSPGGSGPSGSGLNGTSRSGSGLNGTGRSGSSSGWTGLSGSNFDGTGRSGSPGESGLDGTGGRGSSPDGTGRSGSSPGESSLDWAGGRGSNPDETGRSGSSPGGSSPGGSSPGGSGPSGSGLNETGRSGSGLNGTGRSGSSGGRSSGGGSSGSGDAGGPYAGELPVVTGGGSLLPMRDLLRMAAHARHYLVVFDQEDGRPIYLGRSKRLGSVDQRIVLHARDIGCTFPGCGRPGYMCQAHHRSEWSTGGRTDADQLTLVCEAHHRLAGTTDTDWSAGVAPPGHRKAGRTQWIPPAHCDRERRPRMNRFHHPGEYLTPESPSDVVG